MNCILQYFAIIQKKNNYADQSAFVADAKYTYEHIDSPGIGKGAFAHTLVEKITGDFVVPQYIKDAILWARVGLHDE